MLSKLGLALQEAKFYRALRWVCGKAGVAVLQDPMSADAELSALVWHTAQPGACTASNVCSFIGVAGRELNGKWDENGAGAVFFLEQEMSDGITGKQSAAVSSLA
jgi:hypothetical protein